MRQLLAIALVGMVIASLARGEERIYGGRYTAERLANARANCEKYDWAKAIRARAVTTAEGWVAKSDDELWAMVPGQKLPRTIDVTMDTRVTNGPKRLGCLKCGAKIDAFGNYPYEPDYEKKPWKLTCPSCGVVFPTNDFGKYYASGIDEHGEFDPKKANRSLLFNVEHPDAKDPLHLYGVDDGFGFIDENGRAHKFIGYYTWKYWRHIIDGVSKLADAYAYTGDARYAHKAAVLLDRIADVYPEMDWSVYAKMGWYHSDGNAGRGKIEGKIWENWVIRDLVQNYGKVLPGTVRDEALFAFLKSRGEKYRLAGEKGTRDLWVRNVDAGLIKTAAEAILDGRIEGNEGMQQRAMATLAVTLDTEPWTTRWLDWVFAPDGGAVPGFIVGKLDRDGISPEGGPGYALMWGEQFAEVAETLADYGKYKGPDLYKDFPQFRATFSSAYRLCALGVATPNIGDSGATGSVGRNHVNPNFIAMGYRRTKNPELAVAAWRANGNSGEGLGRDIFAKEPDEVAAEIEEIGKKAGPREAGSRLASGYGLALLESKAAGGTSVALYSGRSVLHGHLDQLNFDLLAYGKWLMPDHGYPEFATSWPHREAVTENTLSHNTVVVDQSPQREVYGGHTRVFATAPGVSLVQVDGDRRTYPQVERYRRTMALIDSADGKNAYVVDFFEVSGGKDHVYSLHGPAGEVTVEGVEVNDRPGTYAGEGVALKAASGPAGYSWWYDVRKAEGNSRPFVVDWKVAAGYRGEKERDGTHLKVHSVGLWDDVALADADPPQNKAGNPRKLTYVLEHRAGPGGVSSVFASVMEPFRGAAFVKRVTGENVRPACGAVGVKVEMADGTVDHIVFNPSGREVTAGQMKMKGMWAMAREDQQGARRVVLVNGETCTFDDASVKGSGATTGKIVKMNRGLDGGGWLYVDNPLPADGSMVGKVLIVENDNERDAAYTVRNVTREGGQTRVDCGGISFVRGYAGEQVRVRGQMVAKDYSNGFLYDFEEGATFAITSLEEWEREGR